MTKSSGSKVFSRTWKLLGALLLVAVMVVVAMWQAGYFVRGKVSPESIVVNREEPVGILRETTLETTLIPLVYEVVGTIRSRDEIDVSPRLTARITEVTCRSGDSVEAGEVIARLDDADMQATLSSAKLAVLSAGSALATARSREVAAKAAYEVALQDVIRKRQLYASKSIPKAILDASEGAFSEAQEGVQQAALGIQAAQSELGRARESVKIAETTLDYCTLKSPITGRVCSRFADPGDMGIVGKPVLRVFDPSRLELEANVREELFSNVSIGSKASFTVPALGKEYIGTISEIVPSVDPVSRTFITKVSLGANKELVPGMFGRLRIPVGTEKAIVVDPLRIPVGTEKAILVDKAFVSRIGQLHIVHVRGKKGIERRIVRVVSYKGDQLRIISGASDGNVLVIVEEPAK